MHLKDLREYIQALDKIGEVQSIEKSVDLFLEAGGIIRRSYDLKAPAPLFENLHYQGKEIYEGLRVLGAPGGTSAQPNLLMARAAISMGLKPTSSTVEILEAIGKLLEAKPIKPKIVATGPCKENIVLGDDVDLEKLPAPQINTNDGGRYLNTFGFLVAKTIDGKWVNWGIARVMIKDKKVLLANVTPPQDTTYIRKQWFEQGKPMPVAIVQGGPPIIPFVGCMTLGRNVSECEKVGGYIGKPVELVKCETIDLEVPANAEMVIEGEFSPTETATEGPMGEFNGNVCLSGTNEVPVMNVKAITYRNKGILPVVASGYPIEENHAVWGLVVSAIIHRDLKAAGFPLTSCFVPFQSAAHCLVVTVNLDWIKEHKAKGDYSIEELIHKLKGVLFETSPAICYTKIYLMADDIDPSNLADVFWAFSTRCHPKEHRIYPDQPAPFAELMGYLSEEEQANLRSEKIIYNCLRPADWTTERIPIPSKFEYNWPKDIQERVLKNWSEYGYDKVVE
jgi:4-hydroxy-3-polyprenylbenzoate decarboxylase